MTTFILRGTAIHGIPSFYAEINRLFMAGEDWRLAESLDALNDLLYGGYGALAGAVDVRVEWTDHALSRAALGAEATMAHYRQKLRRPDVYSPTHFRALLAQLEAGAGDTYFDIVLDVFAQHPSIELALR